MQITCPNCLTNYELADDSIGAEGRMVRCAKCGYAWHQEPPEPPARAESEELDDLIADIEETDDEAEAPPKSATAMVSEDDSTGAFIGLFILLILLNIAAGLYVFSDRLYQTPGLDILYGAFDLFPTEDVTLTQVSVVKIPGTRKKQFIVKGAVYNQSDAERRMPILNITLTDAEGNPIETWNFAQKDTLLGPEEHVPFQSKVATRKGDPAYVVLDIGNAAQLSRRLPDMPE